jgi:hypothetical protein
MGSTRANLPERLRMKHFDRAEAARKDRKTQ